MRRLKLMILSLLVCLMLPAFAAGEDLGVTALSPIAMTPDAEALELELYCGPTQGFYRSEGQTLDTGSDYVVFGQYDCWAMAAQGTAESFGPVGWVEAGSLENLPYDPQLGFEDALVTLSGRSANVLVRRDSLTRAETAVILELVMRETGITSGNVKIIPII